MNRIHPEENEVAVEGDERGRQRQGNRSPARRDFRHAVVA